MVLSVELLASEEGVVHLPAPTSHALATCPLWPWPDPQLRTGVTRAPHKLSWLPEATMRGTTNPGPGWPSDKDHPRSPSSPLGAQPQQAPRDPLDSLSFPLPHPSLPVLVLGIPPQNKPPGPKPLPQALLLGETQAKRPSDSPYAGRAISPQEAACSGGPTQEPCAGRDITPSGPLPAWLAPKVLGSLKPPALGHAARRLSHTPSDWHPQAPPTLLSPLIPPSFSFIPSLRLYRHPHKPPSLFGGQMCSPKFTC